jgi:hypothetical protein
MYDPFSINIQKSSAEPHEKEDNKEKKEENEEKDEEENASCDKLYDQKTLYSESDYDNSRAILESRKKR